MVPPTASSARLPFSRFAPRLPRAASACAALLCAALGFAPVAAAGDGDAGAAFLSCTPDWIPTFPPGMGVPGTPYSLASYDGALYVGGNFATIGGVSANRVAKWNGISWAPLGSGLNSQANALAVYDDGNGEALYAGGGFSLAGGMPASRVARWNGTSWSAVGSGIDNGSVSALAVFNGELYAGGNFTSVGGVTMNRIAKWDGTSWSPVGGGMSASVTCLAASGSWLYAGGGFTTAGGVPANRIARWSGSAWSALHDGLSGSPYALVLHDDGGGETLYAGGNFSIASGMTARRVAKWSGSAWSSLGVDDSNGTSGEVRGLASYDDGNGRALYAVGTFLMAGGAPANRIAKWKGGAWSALGNGLTSAGSSAVNAVLVHDDGHGPALYTAGTFSQADGVEAQRLAQWGGCTAATLPWAAVGAGKSGTGGLVPQLTGSGPLTDGSLNTLHLSRALPGAQAHFVLGLWEFNAPFKGGVLVPHPDLILSGLPVSGTGAFDLPFPWSGVPAGFQLWFQYWITDAGATLGFSASNGLRGLAQ